MDTFGAFPLPEKGAAFGISWEGILCAGEGFCQVRFAFGKSDLMMIFLKKKITFSTY
jgi:hypothetical protein